MFSFFGLARAAIRIAASAAIIAIAIGCNSTPTVPVPPPEVCSATAPDVDGFSQVECKKGLTVRNIALVFNDYQGQGVMKETNEDGSFLTELPAESGDLIYIQIMYDERLSAEVELEVPAE
jgi:hypothetical protein